MSEMVERVAKAIYIGRNGGGVAPWGRLPLAHKAPYIVDARIAIQTMRKPTEAMISASVEDTLNGPGISAYLNWRDRDTARYQAMIDAALSEAPHGQS